MLWHTRHVTCHNRDALIRAYNLDLILTRDELPNIMDYVPDEACAALLNSSTPPPSRSRFTGSSVNASLGSLMLPQWTFSCGCKRKARAPVNARIGTVTGGDHLLSPRIQGGGHNGILPHRVVESVLCLGCCHGTQGRLGGNVLSCLTIWVAGFYNVSNVVGRIELKSV